MSDSPPAARTRGKSADKKRTRRSLSLDSEPVCTESKQTLAMAPPTPATSKVDTKVLEEYVKKYISSDRIVEELVSKLALHIKVAVQEAVDTSLKPLSLEVQRLKTEVAALTESVKVLDREMKSRTDDLQQYQRRNNIRVFGVPESREEDTDQLVVKLCKDKLGVDLPVTAICRSHRLGAKPQPDKDGRLRHRPIIVKFVSYRDRRSVFAQKKKLKGSGVVIREDLTATRLEVFRRAAAVHGARNTWTTDGRVMWIGGDGNRGTATRPEELPEDQGHP